MSLAFFVMARVINIKPSKMPGSKGGMYLQVNVGRKKPIVIMVIAPMNEASATHLRCVGNAT